MTTVIDSINIFKRKLLKNISILDEHKLNHVHNQVDNLIAQLDEWKDETNKR